MGGGLPGLDGERRGGKAVKSVLVTTENGGVFVGAAETASSDDENTITLKRARLIVRWGNLLRLVEYGPTDECRIGPPADIELQNVLLVLELDPEVALRFDAVQMRHANAEIGEGVGRVDPRDVIRCRPDRVRITFDDMIRIGTCADGQAEFQRLAPNGVMWPDEPAAAIKLLSPNGKGELWPADLEKIFPSKLNIAWVFANLGLLPPVGV